MLEVYASIILIRRSKCTPSYSERKELCHFLQHIVHFSAMVSKAAQAAYDKQQAAAVAAFHAAAAKASIAKLLPLAERKVAAMKSASQYFDEEDLAVMPKFDLDELTLGRVLGKGGFGTVSEIKSIACASSKGSVSEEGDVEQKQQDKKFIADHCIREGGDARYAIKALSPENRSDGHVFLQGLIDMSVETMFLSVVDHPHIIKMRGIGACGMNHPDYFLILDRLYDTLEARISKWKLESKKANSMMNKLKKKSSDKSKELLETKLIYAYDLMGAIEYLHKKGLIYRDLKPENVGFNIRNDIVLFDFGLAREIYDKDKVSEHTWLLTGETGSLRYMAPEIARNEPYGKRSFYFPVLSLLLLTNTDISGTFRLYCRHLLDGRDDMGDVKDGETIRRVQQKESE